MGCSSSSVDTGTQFVTLPQQTTRPGTLVKPNDVNKVSDDKSTTQNHATKELQLNDTASHLVDQNKNDKNQEEFDAQKIEYESPSKETKESKPPPEETIDYKPPSQENKTVPSAPALQTSDSGDDLYEKQKQQKYDAFDF